MTRSTMLEVLRTDYVRTARAKGLVERAVIYGHALRNGLLPIVTVIGHQFGTLLGGAVLTETVFGWPGMGQLLVDALFARDYPVSRASCSPSRRCSSWSTWPSTCCMALSTRASITRNAHSRVARSPASVGGDQPREARARSEPARRCGGASAATAAPSLGLLVLAVFLGVALLAPFATTYQPEENHLDQKLLEPTPAHLLGTDHLGRDILARLAYGARFSLLIGFAAVGVGLAIGVPLGAVSGFYGGWLDLIIQRVIDVLLSFPGFLLALSLVAVLGVGIVNVILAVGLGVVPAFVRLVRASTLSIRARDVRRSRARRRARAARGSSGGTSCPTRSRR